MRRNGRGEQSSQRCAGGKKEAGSLPTYATEEKCGLRLRGNKHWTCPSPDYPRHVGAQGRDDAGESGDHFVMVGARATPSSLTQKLPCGLWPCLRQGRTGFLDCLTTSSKPVLQFEGSVVHPQITVLEMFVTFPTLKGHF